MRLEHHLVGGYVRYISPYIIIKITWNQNKSVFDYNYVVVSISLTSSDMWRSSLCSIYFV